MLDKIGKRDPVATVGVTFVVSALVIGGILYFSHPAWVQRLDKKTGKVETAWGLLCAYSATFALVCCIAVLLVISGSRQPASAATHTGETDYPSSAMGLAFTDTGRHGHLVM